MMFFSFAILPGVSQEPAEKVNGNSGIIFFEGTWAEALQKSKDENKLIFLDGYASWCPPCIKMIKTVFVQNEVGDFYNANFINVKVDIEKGEGPDLAKKYTLNGYPSLVFMDGEGHLVHRTKGFRPAEDFIIDGSNALDTDKQYYTLKAKFLEGKRGSNFIRTLADVASKAGDNVLALETSDLVFDNIPLKKVKEKEYHDLAYNTAALGGKAFDVVLANKSFFVKNYGDENIDNSIIEAAKAKTRKAVDRKDKAAFIAIITMLNSHISGKIAEENEGIMTMYFYEKTKDWDNYLKTAKDFIPSFRNENWRALNQAAWNIYENVDEADSLKMALEWVGRSIELEKNYYNYDTKAALLFKTGDLGTALLMAKVAVALAHSEGETASETEQMIGEINAQLQNTKI